MPRAIVTAPTQLSGCVLWLDASDSASVIRDGSNLVSQWSDKSGNGNHATEATSANQPTYSATGFGGMPCVDWGNGEAAARRLNTGNVNYDQHTVFFVLKALTGLAYLYAHDGQAGANREYVLFGSGSPHSNVRRAAGGQSGKIFYPHFSTLSAANFLGDGLRHVFTKVYAGLHLLHRARVDGAEQQTATYSTLNANPTASLNNAPVYIGGADVAGSPFRGAIAEAIIFSRALSEGEIAAVEQYLSRKWAIALYLQRMIVSPLEIPDCGMWFDAGQGVTWDGNGVSQWSDASGNGRHITQSDNAVKPTYNPSNAAYGGRPTVDWDVAANGDRLDGAVETLSQPLTFFACCNMADAGSSNFTLFDNATGSELGFGRQNGSNWYVFPQSRSFPTPGVGTRPFVLAMQHHSAVHTFVRINGRAELNMVSAGTAINITHFRLGCFVAPFHTGSWFGSIAEFLVYRRRLVEGEMAAIEAYLQRKYAL